MQHIVKQIKETSKSYNTKSGKKESVSKRVDIGVTDLFKKDDYIAIIFKSDFDEIDKTIADKNATITNLNDSVDKYKAKVESKSNIITDLSNENEALKNKIAKLKSDVSAKDDIIDDLNTKVNNAENNKKENDDLNNKVAELSANVNKLKPLLLSKDETIADLEKQIAIYDAIDVSDLKNKASELDKFKNVIMKLQNEMMDLQRLVSYHKETANAYKNQRWYNKALGRDAIADITAPTLTFIDLSGNPIDKNDKSADKDSDDSEKSTSPNKN